MTDNINGPLFIDDKSKFLNMGPHNYGVYVGDFPPEDMKIMSPFRYTPKHADATIYPTYKEWVVTTTTTCPAPQTRWTVTRSGSKFIASIDLPGCKFEDIKLTLIDGVLQVRFTRGGRETTRCR